MTSRNAPADEELVAGAPGPAVLLTAATRWEAGPLARGLGLSSEGDDRWQGRVGACRTVLLHTGVGAARTAGRLHRDILPGEYGLAVSAGLCGALQQHLRVGDIVADAARDDLKSLVRLREAADRMGVRVHFGRILHTDAVLTPDLKRHLGSENHALACDMETEAVRRWAAGHLPTIGARVVLDEVSDEIPPAPEGEDAVTLARFALAHAGSLPGLIGTGLRSGRAMRTLASFLRAYLEAL